MASPLSRSALHSVGEKAHLFYFGAVFFEGHGWYSLSAGVCLVLGLAWEVSGFVSEALAGVAVFGHVAEEVV